jgi:hypothetical protein
MSQSIKTMPQSKAEMSKHMKAGDLIWKLGQHPALPEKVLSPLGLMEIFINEVCINGHVRPDKNGCIEICYTPQNYKKYKKEFEEEFSNYSSEELKIEKSLIHAEVPYRKVYGYSWNADHIEYSGNLSFMVFIGKNMKLWHEPMRWAHLSGVSGYGCSFEEMILDIGKKFYKIFGDFTEEDFLSRSEKSNHKKEKNYLRIDGKKQGHFLPFKIIPNLKYKEIYPSESNRRWIKWFSETPYGKKHWGDTLKDVLAGKSL